MKTNYDNALLHVLLFEGGYANHPKDPGGPTMKGVTSRVYDAYRIRHGLPTQSVRKITTAELAAIYGGQYWSPIQANDLLGGVDLCTFDAAVNSGVVQAAKWLQRAVGVPADGIVGDVTLAGVDACKATDTIHRSCNLRLAMLRRLKTWPTFGKGWTRRVEATRKASLVLVDTFLAFEPVPDDADGS